MPEHKIKTYTPSTFRGKFMQPGMPVESMFKAGYDRFFIVPVEDMIRQIKLPVPPNRADTHTLICLTDGDAVMRIGSKKYQIFKNECLIVPAGQIFSFDNLDLNTGFLCNFHSDFVLEKFATPERLKTFEFLNVWGNPYIRLNAESAEFVCQLLIRMLREYKTNGLKNTEIIQSCLLALFCELSRWYQPAFGNSLSQPAFLANQFQELVYTHIKTKHLVADYAALLNITPNHLNKVVKQVTGKSPTKWIDETLMLEARVLLYQTQLTVQQVAAEIGIFDSSYFSRMFKKYEGLTPLEFRKGIEIS